MNIKLGKIPASCFQDYRYDVMFDGYKWDLQAGEQSTVTDSVVLLSSAQMDDLRAKAVALYQETIEMERLLHRRPDLAVMMGISKEMAEELCDCKYNPTAHVRFMRFDFHPTTKGWQISEVNSDVPAGYPEASILPQLAQRYFDGYCQSGNFGNLLIERLCRLAKPEGKIAYLHDTHTVEDYQIMHYLGDLMEQRGYQSFYCNPAHIKWKDNIADGVEAIVRYFPVEWLEYEKGVDWRSFIHSKTTSCNHPIALLTQSKRLPLVWDELGVKFPMWRKLLPETKCASSKRAGRGWILKPAFGRVGEGINIPGTLSLEEDLDIRMVARENPTQWVVQKIFKSVPVEGQHLNFGVFVIDGEFAGLYARASKWARIDSEASEIPVLVRETKGRSD